MEQRSQFIDRRRSKRRRLRNAVSFNCQDALGRSDWHLGWIEDAGLGGVRIKANLTVAIHPGQRLEAICLPEADKNSAEQEAVRIQALVAWLGADRLSFGLKYI